MSEIAKNTNESNLNPKEVALLRQCIGQCATCPLATACIKPERTKAQDTRSYEAQLRDDSIDFVSAKPRNSLPPNKLLDDKLQKPAFIPPKPKPNQSPDTKSKPKPRPHPSLGIGKIFVALLGIAPDSSGKKAA